MERAESERFYAAHPMLQGMRDVVNVHGSGTPILTDVLLARVPLGSTRQDAIRILSSENMSCEWVEIMRTLVCSPLSRPSHVPRWHIELAFSHDDKLSAGRAFPLKATAKLNHMAFEST
jgi:hypothetical protein